MDCAAPSSFELHALKKVLNHRPNAVHTGLDVGGAKDAPHNPWRMVAARTRAVPLNARAATDNNRSQTVRWEEVLM
jgi:hypothetical protein